MEILYIERNHKAGFSIAKVFAPIIASFENSNIIEVPSNQAGVLDIFKNLLYVFKHRSCNGINHVTGDVHYVIFSLIGLKTVLTIHDTVNYDQFRGIKRIVAKYLWYVLPVLFARKVVCISNTTRDRVISCTRCNKSKISVIYNPIGKEFKFNKYTFHKEHPVILHIGTRKNKNLLRVIEALKQINCILRIIGELSNEQLSALSINKINYSNAYNLSDEQILHEYENCDIVSFPSLYEGFGMPIIEANKVGRPVLTSYIEPMIEVAADSALFVNPYDVNSIRSGFTKIICDDSFRESLIVKGIRNANRFSLDKIVYQYNKIYESL